MQAPTKYCRLITLPVFFEQLVFPPVFILAFSCFPIVFLSVSIAFAQSLPTLDQEFGENGIVRTDFGRLYEYGTDIVIQNDQKIIAVGRSCEQRYKLCDAAVVRYNTDGSLDPTFGDAGIVILDFGDDENVYQVGLQSDEKIILYGFSEDQNEHNRFLLIRLNNNGSLDTSFGNDGVVIDEDIIIIEPSEIIIQPDDKILIGGNYFNTITFSYDFMVSRYTADGAADSTFGEGGYSYVIFGSDGENFTRDMVLQEDGKVLICGDHSYYIYYNSCIIRMMPDGSLDSTFGYYENGLLSFNVGDSYSVNYALAIQNDGKIVTAGRAVFEAPVLNELYVLRADQDGIVDNSFSDNGILTFDYDALAQNLSLMEVTSDNKIIVAGTIEYEGQRGIDFIMARITESGTLDSTFGLNGIVVQHFNTENDYPYSLAIQQDNKIVISMEGDVDKGNFDFNLARFNPDAVIPVPIDEATTIFTNGIFSNELIVTNTTNDGVLTIFNMLGQMVHQQTACISQTVINTGSFSKGVYLVHFKTGNQVQLLRCIKN